MGHKVLLKKRFRMRNYQPLRRSDFDEIEDFTTQLKRELLPDLQSDLLSKSQHSLKKKKD